jgi:hypothetical protein
MDDGEVSGYEPYSKYLFKVFMGTAFKSACYLSVMACDVALFCVRKCIAGSVTIAAAPRIYLVCVALIKSTDDCK